MSKTRDIKKGLMGLQLNQAMKLKGGNLSLTPPVAFATGDNLSPKDAVESKDVRATRDSKVSQDQSASQMREVSMDQSRSLERSAPMERIQSLDQRSTGDDFRTKDANTSTVIAKTGVSNYTPEGIASYDRDQSLDSLVTSDENEPRIKRGGGSRKATEQDSAVVFAKKEKPGLRSGFTRISNELLMDILEGELSKSEIKVLLLIGRFTTSFQKEFAPLSKTVVERYTHLQGKSVLDAMTGLEEKQLIQKRKGDERSPNQLALAKKYAVGDAKSTQAKFSPQDSKPSEGEFRGADNFAPPFKDSNKYINKYSLSQNSEELREYFENLKPKAKRDEEFRIFGELKSDFSEIQIQLCLEYLQKHGSLKTGEPCHSPMAYLAKAIGQVLPLAQGAVEKAQLAARRESVLLQEQERKQREDAEAERLTREANRRFAESFPSAEQQERKLKDLISEHFKASMLPESLLKRIAVQRWFETEIQQGGN